MTAALTVPGSACPVWCTVPEHADKSTIAWDNIRTYEHNSALLEADRTCQSMRHEAPDIDGAEVGIYVEFTQTLTVDDDHTEQRAETAMVIDNATMPITPELVAALVQALAVSAGR